MIREREEEIVKIQSSVMEINTIFGDLAIIINDQGKEMGIYLINE